MSGDEQDAALLRIVKQRSEAKKRKSLLESELRAAGESLYEIGGALRHVNGGSFPGFLDNILSRIAKAPDTCSLDRIRTKSKELQELEMTLAQLNRSATELGID